MQTRQIKQQVTIKASPRAVYELLMDSKKHSELAGDVAKISRSEGGRYTVGDYIEGQNLELVQDKKIVQTWRYSDWPKGHYSKATFKLEKVEGGTKLSFTQSGVPEQFYEDIKQGWIDYYWTPMKEMLEK